MNKIVIPLLILLLAIPALAVDYTANFQTQIKTNGIWSSPISNSLNVSQSPVSVPGGITFSLYQITASNAWFKVTASPALANGMVDLYIGVNEVTCFRDAANKCNTADSLNSSDGAVKFTLLSITPIQTQTTSASLTNGTSPIYGYIYDITNKEISLKANGAKVVDFTPATGEDAIKEVTVYFRNSQKIPATISVSGGSREPRYNWYSDRVEYKIDEAGTFNFSVKYKQVNPWGYDAEQTDNYRLTIKGLADTNKVTAIGTYRLLQSEDIQIEMTQPGNFMNIDGASATPIQGAANKYTFKFQYPGQYHVKYTTTSGTETFVDFDVRPSPTPPPPQSPSQEANVANVAPTVNVFGNQAQGSGNGDNMYYAGAGFIVLLLIGVILMKRKKESSKYTPPRPGNV